MKKTLSCFLAFMALFLVSSCGKKAPPSVPDRSSDIRVMRLAAVWEGDGVLLEGDVIGGGRPDFVKKEISGCRIYHAWYPAGEEPCEGCPLKYGLLEETDGEVIFTDGFRCTVSCAKRPGNHYFRVALVSRGGAVGPFSDMAKLKVSEN